MGYLGGFSSLFVGNPLIHHRIIPVDIAVLMLPPVNSGRVDITRQPVGIGFNRLADNTTHVILLLAATGPHHRCEKSEQDCNQSADDEDDALGNPF